MYVTDTDIFIMFISLLFVRPSDLHRSMKSIRSQEKLLRPL